MTNTMTEYEKRGAEIRKSSKQLIFYFMQKNMKCNPNNDGLRQAVIFKMCGFDWGEQKTATSSQQQFWIVALLRELEAEGKIQRDPITKKWKLK